MIDTRTLLVALTLASVCLGDIWEYDTTVSIAIDSARPFTYVPLANPNAATSLPTASVIVKVHYVHTWNNDIHMELVANYAA